MQKVRAAMLAATCAVAVVSAMTYVSAQGRQGNPGAEGRQGGPRGPRDRHLVYIATPGDDGTDNQSGVVVLDADRDYSFIKRIPYGLPAAMMPGPYNAGIKVGRAHPWIPVTSDARMPSIACTKNLIY